MPLRPDLRHDAPTDLSDLREDPALAARIRDEIRATGPMSFARFMHLALYDPEGGYYRSADAKPGRGGDFVTAPELHPIFGEMVARAVEDAWEALGRPDPFVVQEHGAGEGALAVPLLDALPPAIRYAAVEVDDRRLGTLHRRLAEAGLADRTAGVTAGEPFDGVVIANEVLDALPVHRVRRRDGMLRELAVNVAPSGSAITVARTHGMSVGGMTIRPPCATAAAAVAAASSTANVTPQCGRPPAASGRIHATASSKRSGAPRSAIRPRIPGSRASRWSP